MSATKEPGSYPSFTLINYYKIYLQGKEAAAKAKLEIRPAKTRKQTKEK